jgi:hypothetical protein
MFFRYAENTRNLVERFRFLMAGVYSARAVVELMLEAADKEQVAATRKDLEDSVRAKLPWYELIEKIRIHDFHRFGLVPTDPNTKTTFLGGPIKLQAQGGVVAYTIDAGRPEVHITGASSTKECRPLLSADGLFYDEGTGGNVALMTVLRDWAEAAPAVIEEFEKSLRS